MPASSRKRNKGKDRKAKKVEKDRVRINQLWWGWIMGDPQEGSIIQCHHGTNVENLEDGHPVSIFMDDFFTCWYDKQMHVMEILNDLFPSHRGVYNSDEYRNMAIKIFTRIGTNMISTGRNHNTSNAGGFAKVITILEHYDCTGDIIASIYSRNAASKCRDIEYYYISNNKRDILKFYRKRTTCKCLKKMHLEARKCLLKKGICSRCKHEAVRWSLSVCSKCMVTQYCTRECQVADWPEHEENCSLFVFAQKQSTMSKQCSDECSGE